MIKLIALLVLLSAVVSCKKDYTITGRIYNAETGEGVANSSVFFTPKIKKGEDKNTIELTTDANGYYSYEGKVNLNKAQRIRFGDFQTHEFHLLAPYERSLLKGKNENREDLAFLRVLPAYLIFKDTNSVTQDQTKYIFYRFRSKTALSFYSDIYFYSGDFEGGSSLLSSKKGLVEGWNYIDGYVNFSNLPTRSFLDSIYVAPTANDSLVKTINV